MPQGSGDEYTVTMRLEPLQVSREQLGAEVQTVGCVGELNDEQHYGLKVPGHGVIVSTTPSRLSSDPSNVRCTTTRSACADLLYSPAMDPLEHDRIAIE